MHIKKDGTLRRVFARRHVCGGHEYRYSEYPGDSDGTVHDNYGQIAGTVHMCRYTNTVTVYCDGEEVVSLSSEHDSVSLPAGRAKVAIGAVAWHLAECKKKLDTLA